MAFCRLSAGRTTFVVAHRLSTIMEADLILVVDQGEIVERGSHEELLLRGSKYWELWTKQTVGKSSKPNSVAEGKKDEAQDEAQFGLGPQDDSKKNEDGASSSASPPLVVLTPADEDEVSSAADSQKGP